MSETQSTHLDEADGLWIPPEFRKFTAQIIFRTPRATIQHFERDGGSLDPYYGMIDETHFEDPSDMRDPKNPELAPNRVSLKPQGEDPVVLDVELEPNTRTDGGIESSGSYRDRAPAREVVNHPGTNGTWHHYGNLEWWDPERLYDTEYACPICPVSEMASGTDGDECRMICKRIFVKQVGGAWYCGLHGWFRIFEYPRTIQRTEQSKLIVADGRRKPAERDTDSDRPDEDLVTDGGRDLLQGRSRSATASDSYPFARREAGVGSYRILDSVERRLSDAWLQDLKRRLYQAIQYFPELDSETVTVGVNQDPQNRDYDRWNPYASAESVNFLIRIPTHEEVSNVTLFHELAHLAIHVLDVPGEDVPASSEEFCSIFAIARQPVQLIDEDRIPYLGSPRAPFCDWPAICQDALAYRDERGTNSHYIQNCRERLEVGPNGGRSA